MTMNNKLYLINTLLGEWIVQSTEYSLLKGKNNITSTNKIEWSLIDTNNRLYNIKQYISHPISNYYSSKYILKKTNI